MVIGRATAKDVAARAGVSRATVSYVLNQTENQQISAETRSRVLAAADELGCVLSNAAARQLRTGTNELVIMAFPTWPIGPTMAAGITAGSNRLSSLGYTALIDVLQSDGSTLDATCARTQPVGLAVAGAPLTAELIARIRRSGAQAILAIDNRPSEFLPTVVLDVASSARVAVRHLAERGRRNLVALMPAEPELSGFVATEKKAPWPRPVQPACALSLSKVFLKNRLSQPPVLQPSVTIALMGWSPTTTNTRCSRYTP